jgi:hypothetical protein
VSKDRSTILRFAVVGFGIAVVFVGFQMLLEPSPWSRLNSVLSAIFIILCLPAVLAVLFLDAEMNGEFCVLWMLVALLNGALYAVIGAAYVGLRKKPDESATS